MVDDEPTASRGLPLAQLAELQRAFESALAGADPESPVPSCGRWSVRELAEHLGSVHVWAAGKVLGEGLERPGAAAARDGAAAARDGASEDCSLATRYRADAELLRTTLSSVPADHPCQTFTGLGPASFWQRRQIHETLIHLWDLSQALGSARPEARGPVGSLGGLCGRGGGGAASSAAPAGPRRRPPGFPAAGLGELRQAVAGPRRVLR